MAEINLGVGRQKTLRDVVRLVELDIRRDHGAPRRIIAKAHSIQCTADRDEFDGPFTAYEIRVQKAAPEALAKLEAAAAGHSAVIARSDHEGDPVFVVTGERQAVDAAVDALSAAMALPEVWNIQGDRFRGEVISVEMLFKAMVQYKASDVHLSPGESPLFRVDSEMHRSDLLGALSGAQILAFLREMATEQYWNEFRQTKQTSFNFHQSGIGYTRVSAFLRAGSCHVTMRFLPEKVPSFADLHIPEDTMIKLAQLHHGLLLVCGMTGSGKSTTVAALVDWINTNKQLHILSIENPVEYVHHNKKSVVSQRATGIDVATFDLGVTGALRHDPDVIVIGEMRDADTIRSAINAAATGHLVISTLHSNTAYESINRIVSFFDPIERDLVRLQLREAVRCVICQRLVPRIGGGRVPALEFLLNDIKAVNDGILSGDSDQIRIGMQQTTSSSFIFEEYLFRLQKDKMISPEMAGNFATDKSILDQMIMGTYTVPRLESIKHH